MRIICNETGKLTRVTKGEFGELEISAAMTRLIKRETGFSGNNYYAQPLRNFGTAGEFRQHAACRRAEIVRPCGDLTEHTGQFRTFSICG